MTKTNDEIMKKMLQGRDERLVGYVEAMIDILNTFYVSDPDEKIRNELLWKFKYKLKKELEIWYNEGKMVQTMDDSKENKKSKK